MNIETLPRGEFILTTPDGKKVRGKLGTWSFQRFCEKQKLSLSELEKHFKEHLTLNDAVQFLLSAIEYPFVKDKQVCPITDVDICEWIDEEGGLKSLGDGWFNKILAHGFPDEEEGEDKKKVNQPTGEMLKKTVMPQDSNQTSTLIVH